MNRKVLTDYGILQKYPMAGDKYEFARRTTFVIDKKGDIKNIEFDSTAIDPTNAVAICTDLHHKGS